MQDNQSLTSLGFPQVNIQFPEHEQLKCPRCDSTNTKFCYYNNYNLSQPRHFCKNCRRYWTKGGTLRNIPVGGGCRKNSKRPAATASSKQQQQQQERVLVQNPSASAVSSSGPGSGVVVIQNNHQQAQNPALKPEPIPILGGTGIGTGSSLGGESFTSLLGLVSDGHFSNFIDGSSQNTGLEVMQGSEGFTISGLQNGSESNCWASNNNEWPNLAINTSGSKLH